jgi:hypothetical protein
MVGAVHGPAAAARKATLIVSHIGAAAKVALALVPLIPIVIGVALIGTRTSQASSSASAIVPYGPPPVVSFPRLSPTPPAGLQRSSYGSEIAVITRATTMRTRPDGPVLAEQPVTTPFGSQVAYLVREVQRGWLGVVSPLAGNNRLGWISATDAVLSSVDWKLEVSLATRRLKVIHNGHVVRVWPIAIGRPDAPTPTGVFAVTDRLSTGDPLGPYGCCILALSALAPHAIQDWFGGDRIAIHSTPPDTYWSIGEPVTHGCMHVTLPEGQWLIDHVPLGTPAVIRSD